MAEIRHEKKSTKKKYTGTMKWLDTEGVGYIVRGEIEVLVTPLSLSSSDTIKQGDKVSFRVKRFQLSKLRLEATDVTRVGVECRRCLRTGHYSYDCPDNMRLYWVNCYKCGLIGHYADNCGQKFYGWFADQKKMRSGFVRRLCKCKEGCWLSLFGGACRKIGSRKGRGSGSGSNKLRGPLHFYWPHLIECRFNLKRWVGVKEEEEEEEEELRFIVCVKKQEDVKKVEEVEDCFILEFDPSEIELPNLGSLSLSDKSRVGVDYGDDVRILAEKGKVACRDYPHPRHLCATNPFQKTPHKSHCKMCYCYICDVPAPCKKWTNAIKDHKLNHCDATDEHPFWRSERKLLKKQTAV